MRKNLTVIGNSLGIIIEKPIFGFVGNRQRNSDIEMITDGQRLILEPVKTVEKQNKIKEATRRVMKNHDETLRELAK